MKTCKRLIFALSFLLLVSCQQEPAAEMDKQQTPVKVVQVSVEEVRLQDMVESFTLPGSLEAWEDLTLAAELAGPVRWIGPQEGDKLVSNQELARIDSDTLKSDHERYRSTFEVRNRKLERYRKLIDEQLVSQQELDNMELALDEARADLRHSELLLEKSSVRTPINGILDDLLVDVGEYVKVGDPLLRIVQVDRLKVLVDVPEKDVPFLQIGETVKITPAVINDTRSVYHLNGTIEYIAYTADDLTRTYRARIIIDNSSGLLRPGMIVRARFVRQQMNQVISAPLYAVLDRDDEKLVFVEEEGVARQQVVTTGSAVGQRVIIHRGLKPGERLIVKGQQLLVDGARVASGGN